MFGFGTHIETVVFYLKFMQANNRGRDEDGQTKIDVKFENETVWLTQAQLCELYKTSKSKISEHMKVSVRAKKRYYSFIDDNIIKSVEVFGMVFRLEEPADYKENENVTREAFWDVYRPGCNEHLVLHKLREAEAFIQDFDYVCVENGRIVANIVYSKMNKDGSVCNDIIAFGPVSVLPERQNQGIGSMMITETLKKAKEKGYKAVLITGNPKYYHRFGFCSASKYHIYLPGMDREDEAAFFMAVELEEGYLSNHAGVYGFDACYEPSGLELEEFEKQFPYKEKREPREDDL